MNSSFFLNTRSYNSEGKSVLRFEHCNWIWPSCLCCHREWEREGESLHHSAHCIRYLCTPTDYISSVARVLIHFRVSLVFPLTTSPCFLHTIFCTHCIWAAMYVTMHIKLYSNEVSSSSNSGCSSCSGYSNCQCLYKFDHSRRERKNATPRQQRTRQSVRGKTDEKLPMQKKMYDKKRHTACAVQSTT